MRRKAPVEANGEERPPLRYEVGEGACLHRRHRHRLLDEDGLARLHRGPGQGAVLVVAGGDVDDLDLGVGQQLPEVGRAAGEAVATAPLTVSPLRAQTEVRAKPGWLLRWGKRAERK